MNRNLEGAPLRLTGTSDRPAARGVERHRGPWPRQAASGIPVWQRAPGCSQRRDRGRAARVSPASVSVMFHLSAALPIALYKCAIDVKWAPQHIRSGRWGGGVPQPGEGEQTAKPKPGSDHQEAFKGWLSREGIPRMDSTSLPSPSGGAPGLTLTQTWQADLACLTSAFCSDTF